MVELQQHIRAIAYAVAGVGILLAIASSLWLTSRFSRPIEQLAAAASEVAAGNWNTAGAGSLRRKWASSQIASVT